MNYKSMFIVMVRSCRMPAGARRNNYKRVGLVEVEPGYGPNRPPAMLSLRSRGVVRIVDLRERLYLGGRPRGNTATEVAIRELQARADRLNAGLEAI